MKKLFVSLFLISNTFLFAQTSNKVAVVDIDFILKKSPEYVEANKELQKRAKEWELTVQKRKAEIKKLRDQLSVERPLLTQQLIDEKDEEIQLLETELLNYQQSKFGVDGEYFAQKINLAKPIQDQIYTIVNDIAEKKRYTMVLDKNDTSNSMLYAKKNSDITDLILRELEKTRNRGKLSKKEIAQMEELEKQLELKDRQRTKREELAERQRLLEEENEEVFSNDTNSTPLYSEIDRRKKEAEDRLAAIKAKQEEIKAAKLKQIEERKKEIERKQEEIKLAREKAQKEIQERKEKILADRQKNIENAKNGTSSSTTSSSNQNLTDKQREIQRKKEEILRKKQEEINKRRKEVEDRKKEIEKIKEERRKEAEIRRQESLKKREEALKNK